jgi:hypothetical protein
VGPPSASTAAKSRDARTVVARWPRRNDEALVMNARGGVSPAVPWSRTSGFGRHPFSLSSQQTFGPWAASAHPFASRASTREPPPPVASVWRLGRGRAAMRDAFPHAGRERACAPAALRPSAATSRPATSPAARPARPAARPLGGWVDRGRARDWQAAGAAQPGTSCGAARQHHGDPSHCWARCLTDYFGCKRDKYVG